jgi:hypothetical protein
MLGQCHLILSLGIVAKVDRALRMEIVGTSLRSIVDSSGVTVILPERNAIPGK